MKPSEANRKIMQRLDEYDEGRCAKKDFEQTLMSCLVQVQDEAYNYGMEIADEAADVDEVEFEADVDLEDFLNHPFEEDE